MLKRKKQNKKQYKHTGQRGCGTWRSPAEMTTFGGREADQWIIWEVGEEGGPLPAEGNWQGGEPSHTGESPERPRNGDQRKPTETETGAWTRAVASLGTNPGPPPPGTKWAPGWPAAGGGGLWRQVQGSWGAGGGQAFPRALSSPSPRFTGRLTPSQAQGGFEGSPGRSGPAAEMLTAECSPHRVRSRTSSPSAPIAFPCFAPVSCSSHQRLEKSL